MAIFISPEDETGFNIVSGEAVSPDIPVTEILKDISKETLEIAKPADQTAEVLNRTTQANRDFLERQQERYKTITDEQGNPLFGQLQDDIAIIGEDILKEHSQQINDPEVANQFAASFKDFIEIQSISAGKIAREQQIQYSTQSLDAGLSDLISQASKDSIDQELNYEQQGKFALQGALIGKTITVPEYNDMLHKFEQDIRASSLSSAIYNDREQAKEILSKSPEELGILEETYEILNKTLESAEKSDEIALEKALQRQKTDEFVEQIQLESDVNARIESESIREDELLLMENLLPEKTFKKLKKKFIAETVKKDIQRQENQELASKIVNGQSIVGVSSKKIDEFYDYAVKRFSDISDTPLSMSDRAQIVASIPKAVRRFATELEQGIMFGAISEAADYLSAYSLITDRRLPSLSKGFSKDATLIMEHTQLLVEKGNIDPDIALELAKKEILDTDENLRKQRTAQYNKESSFKIENIEETAVSELEGAESFFGTNRISQEALLTFKQFTLEGFIDSGNKDTAIAYAKRLMDRTHGVSEVSGTKNYMFMPPEKAYPSIPSSDLRASLVTDVSPILPKGISSEDIGLTSDELSARGVAPSWPVFYVKDGIEIPLLNPDTAEVLRWVPGPAQPTQPIDLSEIRAEDAKIRQSRQLIADLTTKPGN